MTPRSFVRLVVIAAATVLAAAVLAWTASPWSQVATRGARLAPGLSPSSTPAAITVTSGGSSLTLQSRDKQWLIKERDDYPADPDKVRALLVGLSRAELVEPKTKRADRLSLLELEDPKSKGAKSRGIILSDAKGGVIADVIVGKRRPDAFGSGQNGTYVRKAGDDQAWLSTADLDVAADIKAWIKPTIFETDPARISHMMIELPGEGALKIERGDAPGAKAQIVDPPEGRKLKDAAAADGIVRALQNIEAEDVRKAAAGDDGSPKVTFTSRDGLEGTLRLRKDGPDYWLRIALSGQGEAKAKAEEAAKRLGGWEFKIPTWKAEGLLKRRADLFEAG